MWWDQRCRVVGREMGDVFVFAAGHHGARAERLCINFPGLP